MVWGRGEAYDVDLGMIEEQLQDVDVSLLGSDVQRGGVGVVRYVGRTLALVEQGRDHVQMAVPGGVGTIIDYNRLKLHSIKRPIVPC